MAKRKTNETSAGVKAFIDSIEDEARRRDARAITKLMAVGTGQKPKMWGTGIVGFGKHKYSGGCLHVTLLSDVDVDVLKRMVAEAYRA